MSDRIADELTIDRGILLNEFEHANCFREGDMLVIYTTNPLRELARYKDSEVTRIIMKWNGRQRGREREREQKK